MKRQLFVAVGMAISLSASALAEEPKVEITSFAFAGSRTRAAEVCGKVIGATETTLVRVTVDEKGKTPGIYNILVDPDGTFCTTVVTYRGTASASVRLFGQKLDSELVFLSSKVSRQN